MSEVHVFKPVSDPNLVGSSHTSRMIVERINTIQRKNVLRRVSSLCKNYNTNLKIVVYGVSGIDDRCARFSIELLYKHYFGVSKNIKDKELRSLVRDYLSEQYKRYLKISHFTHSQNKTA